MRLGFAKTLVLTCLIHLLKGVLLNLLREPSLRFVVNVSVCVRFFELICKPFSWIPIELLLLIALRIWGDWIVSAVLLVLNVHLTLWKLDIFNFGVMILLWVFFTGTLNIKKWFLWMRLYNMRANMWNSLSILAI